MKNLILGMLAMVVVITSCGKDEPVCTADDYVGSYSSTLTCTDDEDPFAVTAIIVKISDSQISFTGDDGLTVLLDVTECQAKATLPFDGGSISTTIDLDGNSFNYVGTYTEVGEVTTCTGRFTK